MTGADGKELEPVFGPGLTGMKNLGNRCDRLEILTFPTDRSYLSSTVP